MIEKIFIIEDDANISAGLQAKFSVLGFQVESNSGSGGIKQIMDDLENFKPDFIILDLILPRADGFDIVKKIKKSKEISNPLIFIFTNLSDEDSRAKGLNLGIRHYFIKNDFNIDEFVEKFKKIIENIKKINN